MSFTAGLYARGSDRLYSVEPGRYVCEETGEALTVVYDYEALGDALDPGNVQAGENRTLDRLAPFLPFQKAESLRYLDLEPTPLEPVAVSGYETGIVWKDESHLPAGTIWSRGSAVVLGLVTEWDVPYVFFSNPGPAGLSLSRFETFDRGRLLLTPVDDEDVLDQFSDNTHCFLVEGVSIDELNDLLLESAKSVRGLLGTPGWNPYYLEGLKTTSFELFEQLDSVPEAVYVGGQSILPAQAIAKGFVELHKIGWIDSRPRIVHVKPGVGADFEGRVRALEEDRFFPEGAASVDASLTVEEHEFQSAESRSKTESLGESFNGRLALAGALREDALTSSGATVLLSCGEPHRPHEPGKASVEPLEGTIEAITERLNEYSNGED